MKFQILLFAMLAVGLLHAQPVEVLRTGKTTPRRQDPSFEFIAPDEGRKSSQFVATLRAQANGREVDIPQLFFRIKYKALQLGANSFELAGFEKPGKTTQAALTLDVYFSPDSALTRHRNARIKNTCFIFLDDFGTDEVYKFQINDKPEEIRSGYFLRKPMPPGRIFSLKQNEFLGSSLAFRASRNQSARFYTFTDFGLEDKARDPDYLGQFFNTKRVNPIDKNLGYLLVLLMPEDVPGRN